MPGTTNERLKADLTLLLVSVIWGSAFVAQRIGNEQVGPFTFNAIRFLVGGLVLSPILAWQKTRDKRTPAPSPTPSRKGGEWRGGILLGLLLFAGASLQQFGLVTTTAGKGGFITGLYVVVVPLLLALFWRERVRWGNWTGAGLAVVGLFLLSVGMQEKLNLNPGDGWVLLGAFMWALHVIAIGRIAPGRDPLRLALVQYVVCALLCGVLALVLEWGTWGGLPLAGPAILYAGVLSTGVAYTAQVFAQRHAPAADAAIIMSMEAVFAALSGWLVLGETLTGQQLLGCGLMLAGMLLAQLPSFLAGAGFAHGGVSFQQGEEIMEDQHNTRRHPRVIRHWWWPIVVCTVLAALAGYTVSSWLPPVYSASVTLLVRSPDVGGREISETLARTYATMLTARPVLDAVIEQLELDETPEGLEKQITIEVIEDTQLIQLSVEDTDPLRAAMLANTIVNEFIAQNQALQEAHYADSLSYMQQQMDELSALIEETQTAIDNLGTPETAEQKTEMSRLETTLAGYRTSYAELLLTYEQTQLAASESADRVRVLEQAQLPTRPIRPSVVLNTALAGAAGMMLAVGLIIISILRSRRS